MRILTIVLLFAFSIALAGIAQVTRDLVGNESSTHYRYKVLSPSLRAKIAEKDVNFKNGVSVFISGNNLSPKAIEDLGANTVTLLEDGSLYLQASLNTIMNISLIPSVFYIEEDGEERTNLRSNQL